MKPTEIDQHFYSIIAKDAIILRYLTETEPLAFKSMITALLGCIYNRSISNVIIFAIRNVEAEYLKVQAVDFLKRNGIVLELEQKYRIRVKGKLFIFTGKADNFQNFQGYRIDAILEP